MPRLVIFGGTTEGRRLCQWCTKEGVDFLYCTATALGAGPLAAERVRVGPMGFPEMRDFLTAASPHLVVDATHPYATTASAHIAAACAAVGIACLRVLREASDISGCTPFFDAARLLSWLEATGGGIFAATGVKEAALFTRLRDFRERVWFRLLPTLEGLKTCLEAGYPREHLILMWGPFSEALNKALFVAAGASILVTKDSGQEGGFPQKKHAALALGMHIALLERPLPAAGLSCNEAILELERRL